MLSGNLQRRVLIGAEHRQLDEVINAAAPPPDDGPFPTGLVDALCRDKEDPINPGQRRLNCSG